MKRPSLSDTDTAMKTPHAHGKSEQPAIYVLTPQGLPVGEKLAAALGGQLYVATSLRNNEHAAAHLNHAELLEAPEHGVAGQEAVPPVQWFSRLPGLVAETFHKHSSHIFVAATGIVVRCIAPHIRSKTSDPAVLVVDQRARFVISLLSGHLGGANAATGQVAAILGATPVITTATDLEDLPAVDVLAQEHGLAIANPGAIKTVSAALLAGQQVVLYDPDNWLGIRGSRWAQLFRIEKAMYLENGETTEQSVDALPRIIVTEQELHLNRKNQTQCLILHPPVLFAGVGCKRGTPAKDILARVREVFASYGISLHSLVSLASIDIKQDEQGLIEAAQALDVPLQFFPAEVLAALPVTAPSPKAKEVLGVQGVSEPAALAAAGKGAVLLVPKTAGAGVTVAVGIRQPSRAATELL